MTPPNAPSEPPGPLAGTLDSTAQLMNRITTQLGSQLCHVALNGIRRPDPPPTLVVAAHGSRDPRTLDTVRSLLNRVRELRPSLPLRLGHIELNEPLLSETLADLAPGRAVLVPLLLGRGYHVKHDLPAAAADAPHLDTRVATPLGPHPLLVEALYARLVEAGWPARELLGTDLRRNGGVVLAAAGSRDPDGLADTRRTAEELAERLGVPVLAAYASAAAPTVPTALRALAARGRHRVAVASYFTAPGYFAAQAAAAAPWIAAAPLGAHAAVARLLLRRYDEAVTTFGTAAATGTAAAATGTAAAPAAPQLASA
ncbi:sirohydrochlorin chelatase [Streptomyces monticola]|uniref:Sirohydrochlorin chelatase n=1 Tax=Streptomyces monticola TaxID=2666263 RepID=A0ABW2JHW9_9ACTN